MKATKRLISVLVCLMMVLAMLPMAVFADGTTTLYCQAPDNWTNCNVYWWGSAGTNPGWPGEPMTQDAEGIWMYDVPADATNVIFNNGSSQTADLTMPTDDNVMFVFAESRWAPYGKVEVVTKYYVAGDSALCGSNWSPSDSVNEMTGDETGIYTKTYTAVAPGSYQLKVTNGTWDASWGGSGENGNFGITVDADDSTVEVIFDSNKEEVDVRINGTLVPRDHMIAQEDATFADADASYTYEYTPADDGDITVDVFASNPGYCVEIWEDGVYADESYGDSNNTLNWNYGVTAGKKYTVTVYCVEMLDETLYDYSAGSVSFKIVANVPAQENQGGDQGGSSEADPMVIDGTFNDYIEAGQTIYFLVDISDRMMAEGIYSQILDVTSGTDFTVVYREEEYKPVDKFVSFEMFDRSYQGRYAFSVTNNGADKAFFSVTVKDRPNYVISEQILKLGANDVTPDFNYEYTLCAFEPEETGVYKISTSAGIVGNWGTTSYPNDQTENKTDSVEWTCTEVGQHVLIGVSTEEETVVVTVERTGDYVAPEIVDWTIYENTYDFSKEIPSDAEFMEIDVTDDQADKAVLDADGFYRYGSAYGPLMVVDFSKFPIDLEDAQLNGQLRAYVYDADGNLIARNDYNEAIMEYMLAGITPVTEELGRMLQEIGKDKGWYEEGGFVFTDSKPSDPETAWMTFCSYIKGSELTPPADGGQNGSQNGNQNSNQNGNNVTEENPKTGDSHLLAAALSMTLAGAALLTLKKKETN